MSKQFVAAELFSAAKCNMNCNYCYIEKNEENEEINNQIVESMKDGTFIKDLKKVYGEELKNIGLWGTEPTMNMDVFTEYLLPELFNSFPKLNEISFSTNMLQYYDKIVKMIEKVQKECCDNQTFYVSVQLSDDGLHFTDLNRYNGASSKIIKNTKKLINELDNILITDKVKVSFSIKPTLSMENITELVEAPDKVFEWYRYFEEQYFTYFNQINNKNLSFVTKVSPTFVLPDNYNKQDGEKCKIFFNNIFELSKSNKLQYMRGSLNGYINVLSKIIKNASQITYSPYIFTCSAGDTQRGLGINSSTSLCHRAFYIEGECFRNKNFNSPLERFIFYPDNLDEKKRVDYISRGYHDFMLLKFHLLQNIIKELIIEEEIERDIIKKEYMDIFTLFILVKFHCVADNLLYSSSAHLPVYNLIKLWGNGAFKELLKDYLYWRV